MRLPSLLRLSAQQTSSDQQDADRQREELLESLGLRVLRIQADEIISDIDTVLTQLDTVLLD